MLKNAPKKRIHQKRRIVLLNVLRILPKDPIKKIKNQKIMTKKNQQKILKKVVIRKTIKTNGQFVIITNAININI
jgi:hypothetical protein